MNFLTLWHTVKCHKTRLMTGLWRNPFLVLKSPSLLITSPFLSFSRFSQSSCSLARLLVNGNPSVIIWGSFRVSLCSTHQAHLSKISYLVQFSISAELATVMVKCSISEPSWSAWDARWVFQIRTLFQSQGEHRLSLVLTLIQFFYQLIHVHVHYPQPQLAEIIIKTNKMLIAWLISLHSLGDKRVI